MHSKNRAGDRSSQDESNRNCRHKERHRLGPVAINEPVREINDHAGKEPRLRRAEEKTPAVKLQRAPDKTGQSCQRTPCNQRERQQTLRAPAFHQKRPGNLQPEITNKEDSTRGAKDRVSQTQVAFHPQRGVGDIRPIQIVRDVEDKEKRQQPPRNASARACSNVWPRRNHGCAQNNAGAAGLTMRIPSPSAGLKMAFQKNSPHNFRMSTLPSHSGLRRIGLTTFLLLAACFAVHAADTSWAGEYRADKFLNGRAVFQLSIEQSSGAMQVTFDGAYVERD